MVPHDELRYAETQYVLADPGRSYIACAGNLRGELGLKNLPAARCEIAWVDCQTGETAVQRRSFADPGDRTFKKPPGFGPECAAWIRFPDIKRAEVRPRRQVRATAHPTSLRGRPTMARPTRPSRP